MKLITQKHENGCVPACIAILANVSYEQGLKLVHPRRKKWNYVGTSYKRMTNALIRAGFIFKKRSLISLYKLKCNAILTVEHNAYGPPGNQQHAVVWDFENQKILDPYPSKDRSLKRKFKLKTYEKNLVEIVEVR